MTSQTCPDRIFSHPLQKDERRSSQIVFGFFANAENIRWSCFAGRPGMEGDGRINWVLDVSGVRLLGLDTVIPGQGGGEIDAETLDFLDGALQDAASRPVLLATHHPPFSCGIRFMDSIGLEGVEALARRLAVREGDLCSISGHVHGIHVSTVGGGPAITCPSLTSTFSVDFRDDAPVDFTTQAGAMFCMTGRAASAAASCPLHLELAHTRLRPETSSLAPPSTCAPIRP